MTSLPPFRRRPLPAFPGYLKALGPGIVWLAQGSGELIWWPYIVARYGLAFLFLLVPACLIQWPVNYAIGRCTILTGESILRGFLRMNRWFGISLWVLLAVFFLWVGALAPSSTPGPSSTSTTRSYRASPPTSRSAARCRVSS